MKKIWEIHTVSEGDYAGDEGSWHVYFELCSGFFIKRVDFTATFRESFDDEEARLEETSRRAEEEYLEAERREPN